ncbi:MAG: potassium/proton antiporter [Actinomycetes bacterium]
MNPLLRAVTRVQRRPGAGAPGRGGPSTWRLLGTELVHVARTALHPVKLTAAVLVAIGVGALLGPSTPGPVLGAGWRTGLAVGLGMVAAAVAHELLRRDGAPGPGPPGDLGEGGVAGLRVVLASLALVLTGTLVVASLLAVVAGPRVADAGGGLSAALAVDAPLLLGAAVLLAGVLVAGLGSRLPVPAGLLFLGLGLVLGPEGVALVSVEDPVLVQSLGIAALAVILFEGGLTTEPSHLREGAAPGLVLATVGVAITAGTTAVGAMLLLDLDARLAWTIGAVVASTDAAAVFDLLRRTPLPGRLAAVLRVESGANDPVAVLLTVGLLSTWQVDPAASTWLAFGAAQVLAGSAVGIAGGWLGALLLRRVALGSAGLYPILALAVAGVTYGTAANIGGSGLLAVYLCGVVVARQAPRRRSALLSFHTALAAGVEVGLFLLLGLLVVPSALGAVVLPGLAVAAVLLFIARPLAVAVGLGGLGFGSRDVAAVSWLGLRGAVPIVLATLATTAGVEGGQTVLDVVLLVVVMSAVVQGTTAGAVLRRLGLAVDGRPSASLAAAIPLEDVELDVLELTVPEGSPLAGRPLRRCPPPAGMVVAAVVRDGRVLVPRGETVVRAGDVVVATTTDRVHGLRRLQDWVHQPA